MAKREGVEAVNTAIQDRKRGDAIALRALFDYQRFIASGKLQSKIDAVYDKYLACGVELADEDMDVSAAGEALPPAKKPIDRGNE